MRKIFLISAVFLLAGISLAFAQQQSHDEQLTITTYYPSPYGSYNSLYVGKGGLKLGKPVENIQPNIWNNIENVQGNSSGLFLITMVPKDGSAVASFMILFSAGSGSIGMQLIGGPVASGSKDYKEQWGKSVGLAQFRAQDLQESNSFAIQIKPTKECTVYIGKILSYWLAASNE